MLSNISLYLFGLNLGWKKIRNMKIEIRKGICGGSGFMFKVYAFSST
jgi:hypothetical protein